MAKDCPTKQHKKHKTAPFVVSHSPSPALAAPSRLSNRLCNVCKSAEHLSANCPHKDDAPLRSRRTARPASSSAPPPRPAKPAVRPCYRCGSAEHVTLNCPVPKECHYCQSTAHLASACPSRRAILHARTLATPKACSLCQAADHIARLCPSVGHRPIYRDEAKDRALACYVCGDEAHHAVECPEVERLHGRFKRVERDDVRRVGEAECNALLELCGRVLEYRGALWLHRRMAAEGISVTEVGWAGLTRLHDVSGRDQSQVTVDGVDAIRKPRKELRALIAEKRARERDRSAEGRIDDVRAWAMGRLSAGVQGAEALGANVFGLCKLMRAGLDLSAKESREVAMALIHKGWLRVGKDGVELIGGENAPAADKGKESLPAAGKLDPAAAKRRLKRMVEKRRKKLKKAQREQGAQPHKEASANGTGKDAHGR